MTLPGEVAELQHVVRRLAHERVAPRARAVDLTDTYPQDWFDAFREAGLLGLAIPSRLGGSDAGILGLSVAVEEVAKYSSTAALMLLLTRLPTGPILFGGTPQQQELYVAPVASGEQRAAFGLSEPQAGSDVMGIRTHATRDGEGWRLTGTKCWMSGIEQADWYCVFAKVSADPSARGTDTIGCFVVARPEATIGRLDAKMGVHGVSTGELILDGARAERVEGDFRLCMRALNSLRPVVAARGAGLAAGCLMRAVEYVEQREVFGQTVADFQGVQWEIAKLATDIEAARLLAYRAARMVDDGRTGKADVAFLSMAKYFATELAVRASGMCLQLCGAAGYMADSPLEQAYRDARQLTIVEGTSQVQLGMIARGVLERDLWWD